MANKNMKSRLFNNKKYWIFLERLIATNHIVIDRPRDSEHPCFPDLHYPLDYGYLQGTHAGDGDGIDIWIGTSTNNRLEGVVLTVDLVKKDVETKLLYCCTREDIERIVHFLNGQNMQAEVVLRD